MRAKDAYVVDTILCRHPELGQGDWPPSQDIGLQEQRPYFRKKRLKSSYV